MNYLITYDISADTLRTKLATLLLQNACDRLQKSVFLAPSFKKSEWIAFQQALNTLLHEKLSEKDSIHLIPIQKKQLQEVVTFGNNETLVNFLKESFYFFI